jgi:sugar phosphate isomerase/epimerase
MQVGLDGITLNRTTRDPLELLKKVVAYDLEGVQTSASFFDGKDDGYFAAFNDYKAEHDLYVELAAAGVNPRDSGKTVDDLVENWKPVFELADRIDAVILNTCFGLYQERMMMEPSFQQQVAWTTETLSRLAPMAEAAGKIVTMEIHVDLWSTELVGILEDVNSPAVRANMDTANPLGLVEDPVEAARNLAPYAATTHYKDTCIYLTDKGYNWCGGAALGTGLVDLPTVTKLLYEHNPGIHLNIEDGWGVIPIPFYDEAFLNSFPDLTPVKLVRFYDYLRRGEQMLAAGIQPSMEDFERFDGKTAMEARLFHSAEYARNLRDEIEGQ